MINPEDYMLYGFLAFISLLLVTIIAMLFRQSRDIGRLEGQISGMKDQISGIYDQLSFLNQKIDAVNSSLTARIERLEEQIVDLREQIASLREQVAEIRGMLTSLNERVDLLLRHRHNNAGQVVITPEEVAAD